MIHFLLAAAIPAGFAEPITLKQVEQVGSSLAQAGAVQPAAPAAEPSAPGQFPYASLQLGGGIPNNLNGIISDLEITTINFYGGFNGELAVGYKFNDFRTDVSLGYSNYAANTQNFIFGQIDSGAVPATGALGLWTVMFNGYYDMPIRLKNGALSRWSPYLGGGVGYANLSLPECANLGACYGAGSTGAFAWQAKAGMSYRALKRGFLFVEGGYLGTNGNLIINEAVFDPFGGWRFNLGWRQGFGGGH